MTLFGTDVRRVEDPALLRGEGRYVADIDLPGALQVVYVTSTMAHATIERIDVDEARSMPGVVDVVVASDLDIGPYPHVNPGYPPESARPLLADGRVRFVGEAVVAIVAETEAQARDAADAVVIDYTPLPVVVDAEASLRGEVLLYPGRDDNVVLHAEGGDGRGAVDRCETVVEARIVSARVAPCPLETRVGAASWDDGKLTYYASCQGVHPVRTVMADVLGIDADRVRVISPEVGGSFGAKGRSYPEELLLPWLSRRLGRPTRWVPTRSQDMVGLGHSRAQLQHVRIGGRSDGTIEALEVRLVVDSGAYPLVGAMLGRNTGSLLSQVYRIPHISWTMDAVATNTTPTTAYRGAGRPEAAAIVERAVDLFATHLGLDAVDVRRRNLIPADAFPYRTATDLVYDSGDYEPMLDAVLEAVDHVGLRAEQARRRDSGVRHVLGIGLAMFVDRTAGVPGTEYAGVALRDDGSVLVRTGSNPYGQGHHTGWAMLVADRTGLALDRIEVVHGDTDIVPRGGITGGSRSVQRAGSAVAVAADELVAAARRLAAQLLEASEDDIVLDVGAAHFSVVGTPARSLTWLDLATAGVDERDALACEVDVAGGSSFPAGAYVAVVEVDLDTGAVRVVRFVSVDDAGRILNPLLALGQVHGGIAQGIGQALTEEVVYDADGNPLTANFADYGIISATEVPSFETALQETPSPENILGAKGIAESGTIGAPPAVQNAVVDALAHLGVRHVDMPCTPERVWRAIVDAS